MNKVLVVTDMQNDFISGTLGSKEAEGIVDNVYNLVKDFDGEIIFTRDTHFDNYLSTQEGKNLPVVHCKKNTYGWEIHDKLKEFANIIFDKECFGSKELGEYLANKNKTNPIDEIIVIGLCTDICVISNVVLIKAYLPEVKVKVVAKCSAGVSVTSHKNALEAMKMIQVEII